MMEYAAYVLIVLGSNVLGAIAGFGAGMVSIPFLTQIFDAKTVIVATTLCCLLNITIAVKNRKSIDWRGLRSILLYMCIGLPVGVWVFRVLPVPQLKLCLGVFMVVLGVFGILRLRVPAVARWRLGAVAKRVCLVAGGLFQGAIASGGSFVVLYAQQELTDKQKFRSTMALLWSVISALTVAQYLWLGEITSQAVSLSLVGVPATLAGIWVGGKICRRLSQRLFLYLVNLLILAGGVINCATTWAVVF